MEIRLFSAADVRQALPMAEAIEAMKTGYAQLSAGKARAPLRTHLSVTEQDSTLIMPFYAPDGGALGLKVVSVFNSNISRSLPLIHSLVLVVDAETGQPQALIEGSALTAIRTGAASGAATDLLARPDASVVAILGSGVQARRQLEAVCTVRQIRKVLVFSLAGSEAFVEEMAGKEPVPNDIQIVESPAAAVRDADIICTATTSRTPVFNGHDLKPGTHINGIGSFTPDMQEIDSLTVQRARVVVDSREAALAEAGDLLIPLKAGLISLDHIGTELGEIIAGTKPGRVNPDEITFFKSVGVAVQDAMSARLVVRNGSALGLGTMAQL
jgi:ornithine cyclodeaminase/alanine dehydrogenase-like protein (mu-crystallin family)